MAMGGCLLLVMALGVLFIAVIVEGCGCRCALAAVAAVALLSAGADRRVFAVAVVAVGSQTAGRQ